MDFPTGPRVFDYDNPNWARQLLLQLRYNIPITDHDHIARITQAFINRQLQFPMPPVDDTANLAVAALTANGFCRLGQVLTAGQIAEIRAFLDPLPLTDSSRTGGPGFGRDEVPATVNVAQYDAGAIARAPYLRDLAFDPAILPAVSRYLGVPPTIPYLASWWSLRERGQPRDAQLFHIDFHDFKWVKLFVYLTDVDANAGPHVMVRGSHNRAERQKRFEALKKQDTAENNALLESFRHANRFEDHHVEAFFGAENLISIDGRAGEAFLVDTAAIHKGLLPTSTDRLVFQALYSLLPTIKDEVSAVTVPGAYRRYRDSAGDGVVSEAFWRYSTRLILRDPEIEDD